VLLAGSRPEEIQAAEAELNRLRTQQHFLEEQVQLLSVTSPISGVITTPKLKEKVGQDVKQGELIAVVHEIRTVTAEIVVPEIEIADVHLGQQVALKARSFPQKTFYGKVSAIAPMVSKPDDAHLDRTIRVSTRLENPDQLLKAEMSGNAKIHCGERRLFSLITRRLVRYVRVEFWSWW
jgi:putative peptide zinc metalloprotease protein